VHLASPLVLENLDRLEHNLEASGATCHLMRIAGGDVLLFIFVIKLIWQGGQASQRRACLAWRWLLGRFCGSLMVLYVPSTKVVCFGVLIDVLLVNYALNWSIYRDRCQVMYDDEKSGVM